MKSSFYRKIKNWAQAAGSSVAFLPLPMMLGGLLLGVGLYYFETHTSTSQQITGYIPSVALASQETARNVLGLFIGGLITLMVFTFTQMMGLFNQVASMYSPRLLPYFTGDRSLQFTMGYYVGTIMVSLIVLLSIRSDKEGYVPNVSVLFCILLGIIALMIFIYFVTSISSKIQSDNVIATVYQRGIKCLETKQSDEQLKKRFPVPRTESWYAITSPIDGYLGSVELAHLSELAAKFETRFYIGAKKGEYIPRSFPIIQTERKLSEAQIEEVLREVSPVRRKYQDWYKPHLDLLIEIAMKAMSPGINDPGTAVTAIDRINGLLTHLMYVPMHNFCREREGGEVWFARDDYDHVLQDTFVQLRNYSRKDTTVIRALLRMAYTLYAASGKSKNLNNLIQAEIRAVVSDARANIHNGRDRSAIATEIIYQRRQTVRFIYATEYLTKGTPANEGIPL
ncbi:DUF2254 domain-containing protein [Neolewinella antarctica]|uniref:Membrane protein n=1 Tax=Neolewinella antarctica TaxID=442734 RepID=A0ABX0X6I5_9BACT|nr:DUF2254 domain-containing protein [Neolewinella antarctica]NJC24680.1 putative membrane protein [Neolewinella antarctica]